MSIEFTAGSDAQCSGKSPHSDATAASLRESRLRAAAADWSLYFVTDTTMAGSPENVVVQVAAAIRGGVSVVQVRDKHLPDAEYFELAKAVRDTACEVGEEVGREVLVFVNDRVQVAKELGLEAHVGQSDMPVREVRKLLGDRAIIGLSAHTEGQMQAAFDNGSADLFGIGPVWETQTKETKNPQLLPARFDELARFAHSGGHLALAIGGIKAHNAAELAPTATDGICVVSEIALAPDPQQAAENLLREFRGARAAINGQDSADTRPTMPLTNVND
ncbi:MAG: thiamine phosphate synthase [Microbacteriaceae bacterium]|nr:thiamine phosphate synthase [Microbacteriaceae bacterium]